MVLVNTSSWFKRVIESLRSTGDGEGSSSSLTPQIGPQRWITHEFSEYAVSALNYPTKTAEEKSATTPPSRKKKELTTSAKSKKEQQSWETSTIAGRFSKPGDPRRKRKTPECFSDFQQDVEASVSSQPRKKATENCAQRGALNNKSVVGDMFKMEKFLQDERFLNLELPKLIQEEKKRASDGDIDLTIRTSGYQIVQLVSWIRFRSLYHSGKIHIRILGRKGSPMMLVHIIYNC